MLESSGSILQLEPRVIALNQVNLLIITSKADHWQAIASSLQAADTDFTYDFLDHEELSKKTGSSKYSAVLYDHVSIAKNSRSNNLISNLQWCLHIYPNIPFILITDELGDEKAVELIQLGVNGYVLRHKIHQLPDILKTALFNFVSQNTIVQQQQDLINQQCGQIQDLEAEKHSWHQQEQDRQEHIAHLVHELRNPIAAIIGFARALREQYYGKLNDKQKEYASLLVGSGEHLLALVKNYLEITKLDANKQILELERIAVIEICQASTMMVADKCQAKGLELDFKLEDDLDFCIADSMRLKQILINLLSNAIKFTEQGSIMLDVSRQQDNILFAVIDTGTGISPENLGKLFKPFPQISNHHENTGLGLTLSQKLAQLHGGSITVSSELGQGSCFTLCLPINGQEILAP